jgi:hypothetical protein
MRTRVSILAILTLSLLFPAAAIAFVDGLPDLAATLYAMGLILAILGEWLERRSVWVTEVLEQFQLGFSLRSELRDLILLVLVATWGRSDTALVVAVTLAVVLVGAARLSIMLLLEASDRLRNQPVSWRNLNVPGVVRTRAIGLRLRLALPVHISWTTALIGAAMCAALLGAGTTIVEVAALAAGLMATAMLTVAAVDLARASRDTSKDETVERLKAALAEYAPEVVLYYSRPEPIGYIANVWMHPLEQLQHRVLVVVREPHNEPLVQTRTLPVVLITPAGDLERLIPQSVRVALYPSNVAKNNHLIRLTGIVDVFIGHGDSDKGGSATVLTRIFDEVWVSGPAARDRYLVGRVGVRDEQIYEVGRPQLAEIARLATATSDAPSADSSPAGPTGSSGNDRRFTVLYAPTREGFYAEWEYSSVMTQGAVILRSLLALPDVRVLFKPHPGTGTDNPDYLVELKKLKAMVERAGSPHEVVTSSAGLYHAFNLADLLVSDVSGVITDFLASGKPYVVTSSSTVTPEEFRRVYPSAVGAYVLAGDGSDVVSFLADARTTDSMRADRERTARYLLGNVDQDPQQRFADAVEAAITRAPAATR